MLLALLTLGCMVAQMSVHAYGPMISAVIKGYPPHVEDAIQSGADVNERGGWRGHTPLHYAVGYEGPEALQIVQLLLDAGADVNLKNEDGETALQYAENADPKEIGHHINEAAANLIKEHIARLESESKSQEECKKTE